jgi:hypothetical protein
VPRRLQWWTTFKPVPVAARVSPLENWDRGFDSWSTQGCTCFSVMFCPVKVQALRWTGPRPRSPSKSLHAFIISEVNSASDTWHADLLSKQRTKENCWTKDEWIKWTILDTIHTGNKWFMHVTYIGGSFPGYKTAVAWSWPLNSIQRRR